MKKRSTMIWVILIVLSTVALAACGGGDSGQSGGGSASTPVGDPENGEVLFNQTCIACHGEGGIGIEGLGKNMVTSTFIRDSSDEDLLAFVKVGRPVGDPDNTTGVDMPPKGGNPALSDDDLLDIIAYIRALQE